MAPNETVELIEKMTDEEFERHALGILHRELGVYGIRGLSAYPAPGPEITRETVISGWMG